MATFLMILLYAVMIFRFLLLARIVVEMIASFSRGWSPKGVVAVILELLFTVTDPPVKALRKVIKPVRLGQVSLDLSVLVLFIALIILELIISGVYSSIQ